ncbi:hypothetical protein L210DRAFT_3502504 [Boletus edulis BED1]|uniref:BAH domain-containing protein n=1 Tax=Boletus edulis BED1 TaxID=1328754 RepID=A0AAD4BZ02_BOLED|nr:hypothetical protein L210DRAFT_3502504 [Boletus edulis BED1]
MDYWYGSIKHVCMVDDWKEGDKLKIWIYVCWYYHAEDVKCYDTRLVKVARVDERKVTYDKTNDLEDASSGFFIRWGLKVKIVEDLGKQPCVVGVSLKRREVVTVTSAYVNRTHQNAHVTTDGQTVHTMTSMNSNTATCAHEAQKEKFEQIFALFKETTDNEEFIRRVTRPIACGGVHKTYTYTEEEMNQCLAHPMGNGIKACLPSPTQYI